MKHLAAFLVVIVAACSPPTAEDLVRDIIAQRNSYEATPQSWIEREDGTLYIDVLVVNNNTEAALRTLTVLVEQLDIDDQVLTSRRVVMDVGALTPGMGQSVGVSVPDARAATEYVRLLVERDPPAAAWSEFPELDAVRPRA